MTHSTFRLSRLAEASGAVLSGDDVEIRGAGGLADAGPDDIVFLRAGRPVADLEGCAAGAVILHPDHDDVDRPMLRHANPRYAFAVALRLLAGEPSHEPGVHPTAVVHPDATVAPGASVGPLAVIEAGAVIGEGAAIGPHVVIGESAVIGEGCRLDAHAVVYANCVLGRGVRLLAGSVVGADGFGFEPHDGAIHRLEHIGRVVIGDGAEVGANTCVDRATAGETTIGPMTKIDNLVQVGHNVTIGAASMICGMTAVGGTSSIGSRTYVGGTSIVADHARIGDDVLLAGHTGVHGEVPDGSVWSGVPAREHKAWRRETFAIRKLPDLLKEMRDLRRRVAELEG